MNDFKYLKIYDFFKIDYYYLYNGAARCGRREAEGGGGRQGAGGKGKMGRDRSGSVAGGPAPEDGRRQLRRTGAIFLSRTIGPPRWTPVKGNDVVLTLSTVCELAFGIKRCAFAKTKN